MTELSNVDLIKDCVKLRLEENKNLLLYSEMNRIKQEKN